MLLITLAALVALGQAPPLTKAEQLQEAARKGLSALGKPGDFKDKLNTAKLVEIVGAQGEQTGAVYKFTLPRTDLKVVEMGATINARMGSNTWAAFTGTNDKAAIAGDVAMLESEVRPVLKVLRKNGLDEVAIHHHNHPLRRTASPGCWCPDTGSRAVVNDDRGRRLARHLGWPRRSCRLGTVPVGDPLGDQPVSPDDIRRRLDAIDRGDRSPSFGDREADAGSHPLQVSTQVSLQFPDSHPLHT
jgi:hypothetical protein